MLDLDLEMLNVGIQNPDLENGRGGRKFTIRVSAQWSLGILSLEKYLHDGFHARAT